MTKNKKTAYMASMMALIAGMGILVPTAVFAEETENVENNDIVAEVAKCFLYGGNEYETFAEARAAAEDGGVISLDCDVETDKYYGVTKDLTLDLNGHSYKTTGWGAFQVKGAKNEDGSYAVRKFVVKDSVGGGSLTGDDTTVVLDDGGLFTLEAGDLYARTWGVIVFNDSEFVMNGGSVNATDDGSIGVSGNGTKSESNVNYGANAKLSLNAGKITSGDLGVYAPQVAGETVLGEGLTIEAKKAGVEIRAGSLTVDGATIKVDKDAEYVFNPNGSGSTASGVAIAVAQHTTKQEINATVKGGAFSAPVVFAEANPQKNADEDVAKVNVAISGGVFDATNGEPVVASEDLTQFITGGTYSKAVEEAYVAEGYKAYAGAGGANYNVLKEVVAPAVSDDANEADSESEETNEQVLSGIAGNVVNALVSNIATVMNGSVLELNGSKVSVFNAETVRQTFVNGEQISVSLQRADVSDSEIGEEDTEAIDGALAELEEAAEAAKVETIVKKFGTVDFGVLVRSDSGMIGYVTELEKPLALIVDVSAADKLEEGFTRTWNVIRLHEGEAEVLEAKYGEETETIAFESDLFSLYTVVFTDQAAGGEDDGDDAGSDTESEDTGSGEEAPETGASTSEGASSGVDLTGLIATVVVMIVAAVVMEVVSFKRRAAKK